jgi:peptidyl-prolyl cis-trans isomerase C
MIRTFKVFRGVPATWLLVSCAALLSPACWAQATQPRPSVSDLLAQAFVTVDGQPQSRALAEVLLRELAARGTPATPQTLAEVRDALVDQALMVREAARAGLDSNPLMQAQIEILRQRALANAWQQSVLQAVQPSEDELKAEYDRIRGGDKMAALALDYSIDPDTRAEGGLGGWLPEGGLAAPIAQAVKGVGPGQLVPAPVRTSSGWHVLQVEEVRPYVAPPLSQVRPQVRQAIAQRVLQQRLEALRRAAKVD